MFSVYYHWITKYQWITILCILLFFLFFSINKKECFSVGFESDISISSNLFLDSSICKVEDGGDCKVDSDCKSNFCFYSFNSASGELKGKCENNDADNKPNGENNDICLHRSILNNFYNEDGDICEDINNNCIISNFFEYFNFLEDDISENTKKILTEKLSASFTTYNKDYFCKDGTNCSSSIDNFNNKDINTNTELYKLCSELVTNIQGDVTSTHFKSTLDQIDKIPRKTDSEKKRMKIVNICDSIFKSGICL